MGGWGDLLTLGGPFIEGPINFLLNERGNQIARENAQEANQRLDLFNNDIDAERDQWSQQSLYGGLFDQGQYGRGNFEDQTDFSGLQQQMMGDYGQAEGNINSYLTGQMRDPMAAARDAGSFVSDVGTDAFLRSGLNSIGSESKNRFGQASQDLIGRTLGSGRSLGDSRDAMDALRYNENVNRSGAVDSLQAQAENLRNQNMQFRAGLQNQAMQGQSGLNAGLAQSQAGFAGNLADSRASTRMGVSQFESGAKDRDQTQVFDAYNSMLTAMANQNQNAWGQARDLLGMKQSNIQTGAQITAGIPVSIPQSTMFRDAGQNLLQQQATNAAKQEQKGSFSFLGIGGGCIDATATIQTGRGFVELAGVLPGDEVLGEDGQYHKVIAKDCGMVDQEMRHDLVQIATANAVIEATPDHVIDGKPAGQWLPGEKIRVDGTPDRVERITLEPYKVSGDLMLEGNVPYIANGFVVHSNIGRQGLGEWIKTVGLDGFEFDGFMISESNPNGVWAKTQGTVTC